MPPLTIHHPNLGALDCLYDPATTLTKILGLPYAIIPQRFARSILCSHPASHPSGHTRIKNGVFDATTPGPSSIQPFGSVKSDASNIPLPTDSLPDDEPQSEDCLTLSIHLPPAALSPDRRRFNENAKLPVLLFIHGGAYFLGSGNRPYYSPNSFLSYAISAQKPLVFVSINYRLGALGFLHAQTRGGLLPPNNGLHDQIRALEWLQANIGGFGGEATNVTALGQSAGGESLSILSNAEGVKEKGLFKRAIMLSGTPVTMPSLTPDEHTSNFLSQASKLGISTTDNDVDTVAKQALDVPVDKIRDLAWVGLPCTHTPLLPFDKPSMSMLRSGGPDSWRNQKQRIEAQIVGTTTYDGGISFNMMSRDSSRSNHASAFLHIASDVLGPSVGVQLCDMYGVKQGQSDPDALQRICLFESDIGFFFAALSMCEANLARSTYFQIFDLPNPFDGPLREQGEFATHTFDITTLLGGYDEAGLPGAYESVVGEWRDKVLDFVREGKAPCRDYSEGKGAMVIDVEGVSKVKREEYMEADNGRRSRLMELAEKVGGDEGWDVLWVDVCRRFLMKGE
jgi:carboxylesterase type B